MTSCIRRRDFITLLGGAAAAWPLVASAQQGGRVRRIGVLMTLASDDPESVDRVAALAQGLAELGWAVGRNVQLVYRWPVGDPELYRRHAGELVAFAPDVIVAHGVNAVRPLMQATHTVPIVF